MAFEEAFSRAFNTSFASSQQQLPRILKMQREMAADQQTAILNNSIAGLTSNVEANVSQDAAGQAQDHAGALEVLNSMSTYAKMPDSSKSDKAALEVLQQSGVRNVPRSLLNLLNAKGDNTEGTTKLLDYLTVEFANEGQGKKFLLEQMQNPTVLNQVTVETMRAATSGPAPQFKEGLATERMKLVSLQKNRPALAQALEKLRQHAADTLPNADTAGIDAAMARYDASIANQRNLVADLQKSPEQRARDKYLEAQETSRLIEEQFGPDAGRRAMEKALDIEEDIPGSEYERIRQSLEDSGASDAELLEYDEARMRKLTGTEDTPDKASYRQLGMVRDEQGNTLGVAFTDKEGQLVMRDLKTNTLKPVPTEGVRIETLGAPNKQKISSGEYLKLTTKVMDERSGVEQLQNFMAARGATREGMALLYDQLAGQLKTAFGGELTNEEFIARYATQSQEGLLGRLRVEVVGGGVMTEQDALRVIAAMGGPVEFTANKEVAMARLATMLKRKVRNYNMLVGVYNRESQQFGDDQITPIDEKALGLDKFLQRVPDFTTPRSEKGRAASIANAKKAIEAGGPKKAIIERLEAAGIMDHGL